MPGNPFSVHVARLRRVPGTRWHEVRRGPADPEQLADTRSAFGTGIPAGAVATCELTLESFGGGVMVTGIVEAPWQGVCGRCTATVGGDLRAAVKERFTDAPRVGTPATSSPRASGRRAPSPGTPARGTGAHGTGARMRDGADAVDPEAYPIVDDQLDLGPMVHDALILELPLVPLCRPDCRGLCLRCGADRNDGDCGCVAPGDPRWASLDVLRSGR